MADQDILALTALLTEPRLFRTCHPNALARRAAAASPGVGCLSVAAQGTIAADAGTSGVREGVSDWGSFPDSNTQLRGLCSADIGA